MDAHRTTFNDWNTKNEVILQQIEQLENEIDRMQRSIGAKQTKISLLHQEEHGRMKQQETLDAYDTIFNSTILHDIDSQPLSTTATLLDQSQESAATAQVQQKKRRDISEQLMTSAARICHQIERLWRVSSTKPNGTASAIETNNLDKNKSGANDTSISLTACRSIQHEIKQLMETQSSKDYLESLSSLLQRDTEQYKALLPNDEIYEADGLGHDKENGIPAPITPITSITTEHTDGLIRKLDWIEQQQKERLQHVFKVEQDALAWQSHKQTLETQLNQNVKAKYSDPEVQSAFSTCVMAKVESTEESSRLASYESYLDEIKHIASVLEEKHGSLDQIQKETVEAIENVAQQRKNIKAIKTINQHEPEFRAQKEQVTHLMESIRTLQHQLNSSTSDNQALPIVPKSEKNERLESSIDQIGRLLGCLPSTVRMFYYLLISNNVNDFYIGIC
ncbi:hypothetical protein BCR42DRAFT_240577 [Absidia repens]|uniref:Uncharacterized protein n=1 Tax=Absidia repens TaxID=90262 RepID=A0A1X2IJS5_9FUNG|nr:hypothetical protein BCR42DRAFT_240577 [Absidia repens]